MLGFQVDEVGDPDEGGRSDLLNYQKDSPTAIALSITMDKDDGQWIHSFLFENVCGRHVKYTAVIRGYALYGHVIQNLTLSVDIPDPCRTQCVMESRCAAIDIGQHFGDHIICELSDSDGTEYPQDLKPRNDFIYIGTEKEFFVSPIRTDAVITHALTMGLALVGIPRKATFVSADLSTMEKTVKQEFYIAEHLVACNSSEWTLIIKMDGSKDTFSYDSVLWTNKDTFNLPGGKTGLDTQETKLPTYWEKAFSKICLGMRIGSHTNFIVIHMEATSLYSLIADGQYRAISLGRDKWKSLIGADSSLQLNCNKEGFNSQGYPMHFKARIGIIGNEQSNCESTDSRIGFGTGGSPDKSITCGNVASFGPDNGNRYLKAMGYIMVQ
nr:uncharacterized protein LOC131773982 [Pocillopora verrucosa]